MGQQERRDILLRCDGKKLYLMVSNINWNDVIILLVRNIIHGFLCQWLDGAKKHMINEIILVVQGCLIFVLLLLYWRLGKIYEALTHEKENKKKEYQDKLRLLDEITNGDL